MTERSEMAVPNFSSATVFCLVLLMIAFTMTVVAVLEMIFQVTYFVPCLWLAVVAWSIWRDCKHQGGFRKWLLAIVGDFLPRHFVESVPQDAGSIQIRLGFRIFGKRHLYFEVPLEKIETVEWSPGQGGETDWHVSLWFDHDDPAKGLAGRKWKSPKPDQDIVCVGPSRGKKKTEAIGLALVEFLCRAGAKLARGEGKCTFVRAASGTVVTKEPWDG